jgi:hypothetical protein
MKAEMIINHVWLSSYLQMEDPRNVINEYHARRDRTLYTSHHITLHETGCYIHITPFEWFTDLHTTLHEPSLYFFIKKPTRCTNITNSFWHETTCFRQFLCPSSGVHSLYSAMVCVIQVCKLLSSSV